MEKSDYIKGFLTNVEKMRNTEKDGTYFWYFAENAEGSDGKDYDWAIVLGWTYDGDDFTEEDEKEKSFDDGYRLCAKIGFQPSNSIMQCDFDMDWLLPFDKKSGEVEESDFFIYDSSDLNDIAESLWKLAEEYKGVLGNYQK